MDRETLKRLEEKALNAETAYRAWRDKQSDDVIMILEAKARAKEIRRICEVIRSTENEADKLSYFEGRLDDLLGLE